MLEIIPLLFVDQIGGFCSVSLLLKNIVIKVVRVRRLCTKVMRYNEERKTEYLCGQDAARSKLNVSHFENNYLEFRTTLLIKITWNKTCEQ